jgi:hypothetical protein
MTARQRNRRSEAMRLADVGRTVLDFENERALYYDSTGRLLAAETVVGWLFCGAGVRNRSTTARTRERRAHRSAKATRAGPDDDPGPSSGPTGPEFEQFCRGLLAEVRATQVLVAELCRYDDRAQYALNTELCALRDRIEAALDAERIVQAVQL